MNISSWHLLYHHLTGKDITYVVVVPCSLTELPALRKTLLDQLSEYDRQHRHGTLLVESNILCQGTRRSAEWAVRRLREAGIPCYFRHSYALKRLPYPRIKLSSFQGDVSEFVANFPLPETSVEFHQKEWGL